MQTMSEPPSDILVDRLIKAARHADFIRTETVWVTLQVEPPGILVKVERSAAGFSTQNAQRLSWVEIREANFNLLITAIESLLDRKQRP